LDKKISIFKNQFGKGGYFCFKVKLASEIQLGVEERRQDSKEQENSRFLFYNRIIILVGPS
jgi:hypothetical protein